MQDIFKKKCLRYDFSSNDQLDKNNTAVWSHNKGSLYWNMEVLDGKLELSFRGTHSIRNWFRNFNFWIRLPKRPYKNMPVRFGAHRGFLKAYREIRDDIHEFVKAHSGEFSTIRCYGFSKGAAMATLCYEDMFFHFHEETPVYGLVFASPRVFGWKTPQERFKNLRRVEITNDIVTRVPLIILGFKHVGASIPYRHRPFWQFIRAHYPLSYIHRVS